MNTGTCKQNDIRGSHRPQTKGTVNPASAKCVHKHMRGVGAASIERAVQNRARVAHYLRASGAVLVLEGDDVKRDVKKGVFPSLRFPQGAPIPSSASFSFSRSTRDGEEEGSRFKGGGGGERCARDAEKKKRFARVTRVPSRAAKQTA